MSRRAEEPGSVERRKDAPPVAEAETVPRVTRYAVWLPFVILVFSVAQLIGLRGAATHVVLENLPTPPNSSGTRVVELVHPTAAPGRVYNLTFVARPDIAPYPPGARLQLQLSSSGRTRPIAVRRGHLPGGTGAALRELFLGVARLRIVPDRGWIDVGPAPAPDGELRVQLVGLLPAPFGFAELDHPDGPGFSLVEVAAPGSSEAPPVPPMPRYRVVAPQPISPGEVLARTFFFLSASRVLQATALVALLLLAGAAWLALRRRAAAAVACAVPAAILLHAVCLPPLQGADETSHVATVEKIVFRESPFDPLKYPRSIALLDGALDADRVRFHPDEPLPVRDAAERSRLRAFLGRRLDAEARQPGKPPFQSLVQDPATRSPLFYGIYRIFAVALRPMPILDRVSAYRVVSALSGIALFLLGGAILSRRLCSPYAVAVYGLVFLVPYMVGVVASCSNYALAIGLGGFLAAAAVSIFHAEPGRGRARLVAAFLAASWIGILVWDDFVFPAAAATVTLLAWAVRRLAERLSGKRGAALIAAFLTVVALLAVSASSVLLKLKFATVGTRLPLAPPSPASPEYRWMVLTAAAPFFLAAVLAWWIARRGAKSPAPPGRPSRWAAAALPALFAILFLLTPYTNVPFETERVSFPRLVALHDASFWSNNFSWDQDRLFWKFYFGAFGWHDVLYPDWVYALARWAAVAVFVALPVLVYRFVAARPRLASALILVSGTALSFCIVTETLRYLEPSNPFGRFILPFLPMAALPVLTMTEGAVSPRVTRWVLAVAISLQIWTAAFLLPARYALGS